IFATRRRGEVFLTEPDLERFEQTQSSIALIIAGDSAGFFTREPDGSIQSLRSREEVACAPAPGRSPRWQWIPAILLFIAAATIPMHRWWPRDPALSVREDAGQLRIAWTRAPGTLELVDGSLHATLPVTALDSGIAYQPHTGDIAIRLTQERRTASARFIGAEPEASALRAQIAALASEADRLRSEIDRRRQIAAGLAKTLSTMKRAD
ncbi:MAG: hypothetical protein LAO79_11545, partial [Acidobacteriia bacterium]|nr:hypothetical protein [Terriglobia bacterium]